MPFVYKKMETEEEILGKAYVHWKSWQETYPGLVPTSYLEALTLEKCEGIARRWPDNILVAKEGDRVVGFAGYGTCRDGDLDNAGEIFALYVLGEVQRQGIGTELTRRALDLLADHPVAALWVLDGNEKAIRFYEKTGFRFDGAEQTLQLGEPRTARRMLFAR